jgi:ribonuclease-3
VAKKYKAAVSDERRRLLSQLEAHISICFNSVNLLNQAFTHRSYANEHSLIAVNNERLEFLGDSILGMVICDYLYATFPQKNEGELARLKSFLVCEESLVISAHNLKLADYLLIGKGEERTGGRSRKAILADAMEALFAAVYLDKGYDTAAAFILRQLAPQLEQVNNGSYDQDYKTLLQEACQKKYKEPPLYKVVKCYGPEHERIYTVEVVIQEQTEGIAEGRNKKEAERAAAKIAYAKLFKELS